jgi:hypothetical protein
MSLYMIHTLLQNFSLFFLCFFFSRLLFFLSLFFLIFAQRLSPLSAHLCLHRCHSSSSRSISLVLKFSFSALSTHTNTLALSAFTLSDSKHDVFQSINHYGHGTSHLLEGKFNRFFSLSYSTSITNDRLIYHFMSKVKQHRSHSIRLYLSMHQ